MVDLSLSRDEAEIVRTALTEYANSATLRARWEGHAIEVDNLRSKVSNAILDNMLARIDKEHPAVV
jgi:hypothetical protein